MRFVAPMMLVGETALSVDNRMTRALQELMARMSV